MKDPILVGGLTDHRLPAMIQQIRNVGVLVCQDDHLLRTFDVETFELLTRREFVQALERCLDVEELHGWERRRAIIELRRIGRVNMSGPRQVVVLRRMGWNSAMSMISIRLPRKR